MTGCGYLFSFFFAMGKGLLGYIMMVGNIMSWGLLAYRACCYMNSNERVITMTMLLVIRDTGNRC